MKLRLYGLVFGLLLAIAPAACGSDDEGTVDGGSGTPADAGGGGPADAGTGGSDAGGGEDAGGGDDASVAPLR